MFCNSCNNGWLWIIIILIPLFSCGGGCGNWGNNRGCENTRCRCGCH